MAEIVKLEGFRELDKALAELPKAVGKNILRRIGKAALQPMAEIATAKAPKLSGHLKLAIVVSTKRTRRAKKSTTRKLKGGGYRATASTGIDVAMGPSGGKGVLNYAAFVEFGTNRTPPQPYMRPAWDGGARPALDYIKQNLGSEISKAAARLARKKARSK